MSSATVRFLTTELDKALKNIEAHETSAAEHRIKANEQDHLASIHSGHFDELMIDLEKIDPETWEVYRNIK